jgi:hypothetical protein
VVPFRPRRNASVSAASRTFHPSGRRVVFCPVSMTQGVRTVKKNIVAAGLVAVLCFGLNAEEKKASVKSGPQVSETLAGPFHPLNVNGAKAGQKNCLYCQNGNSPVAMIFAREPSPELTKLIKKIDDATVKNSGAEMGSFVVFCNDAEGLEKKLEALAKESNLKQCILSIDNPAGPKGYKVAKEADVTVVLYVEHTVKANFAFKKGEMMDKDIDTIVAAIPTILPKK